jgi:RNA polymerase-binding transcription factor DksA
MATPKKPVGKVVSKKSVPVPVKKKGAVAKAVPVKKSAVAAKGVAGKSVQVKSAVKKAAAKKASPAKPAQAKKAISSPAKAAAAKKAVPLKKSAPAKAASPARKTAASAKKAAPASKTAPKKAAAKAAPAAKKPAPKPIPAPQKKAAHVKPAPLKKVEAKKVETPKAVPVTAPPVKKETLAQRKAALKRTASAVQRVQARVAAAIPKPQPKPAPMPTVMPGRDDKKSNVVIAHRRIAAKLKETEDSNLTMTEYQPEFKRSILDREDKDTGPTYRYSDEELAEFKELITNRLATARRELAYQQGLITHKDATGTDDTENRYMNMEDGSGAMEREQLAQLASRQIQFINHLEKALIRIENKTYGICRVTGKLIDKARLRAVPHATLSIEAKNMMNSK